MASATGLPQEESWRSILHEYLCVLSLCLYSCAAHLLLTPLGDSDWAGGTFCLSWCIFVLNMCCSGSQEYL